MSPNNQGAKSLNVNIINLKIIKPTKSLIEKYLWNEILSKFLLIPSGLLEPVWCKNNKWTIVINLIAIGKKKWSAKNRERVGSPTANPPHNHNTISLPIIGIAENKLVITVAPQKDIWPQGNTYPKNAVAMVAKKSDTPIIQTGVKINLLK